MRHPREPRRFGGENHLCHHVEPGERLVSVDCCWLDPDGSLWSIDLVDAVAVTCRSLAPEGAVGG